MTRRQRLTLKAWFVVEAEQFLQTTRQPTLFVADSAQAPYTSDSSPSEPGEKS